MQPLTRPEISKILEILHRHIDGMKLYKNESADLFQFRQQGFLDIIAKLNAMHQEAKPSPIAILTARRTNEDQK